MMARLQGKKCLFLLPLSGILMALCVLFPRLGFLQWVALTPALLFLFSREVTARRAPLRAYLWGVLYFLPFYLVVYHWFLALYPMEFAGVSKAEAALLVVVCLVGLSLLQTVFSALIFPLFVLLRRTRVLKKWPLLVPFLFAAQYTVAEWSQTLTWMGVPWARLPLGQLNGGFLLGSASLFGSYYLTFALVLFSALLAFALLHTEKKRLLAALMAGTFVLSALLGIVGTLANDVNAGERITVAAVQGNVGSSRKWSGESREETYRVYEKYTAKAAAAGASVVVFPETFLPYPLTENNATGQYVRGLAMRYGVTILCGAFHYAEDGDYNGVFTVYPDGSIDETVYAKRHLVPFGEYVPWRGVIEAVLPVLADMNMLSADLVAGKDAAIVTLPEGRVGGLLCFDSIYEELTRESVREGAELLVLPTNDSWFGDSAAVYMHEGQAQLRAIESGRWIVRAADTGVSAIIDPDGNVHDEKPPLVEGVSIATARMSSARTLYSYIGNLFVYLLIAALLMLPLSELVQQLRHGKKRNA